MKIISRKEAMARGLKRYFTGKSCPRGHTAERFISGCGCVECSAHFRHDAWLKKNPRRCDCGAILQKWKKRCAACQRANAAEWRRKNKKRLYESFKAWVAANPEKIAEYNKKKRKNLIGACGVCGKSFPKKCGRHRMCSKECAAEAVRRYQEIFLSDKSSERYQRYLAKAIVRQRRYSMMAAAMREILKQGGVDVTSL